MSDSSRGGIAVRARAGKTEEVESNLTSMLDLIFNILAFFVVTFNPPLPEKNFDVRLPPPVVEPPPDNPDPTLGTEIEIDMSNNAELVLRSGPGGSLTGMVLDRKPIKGGIPGLARDLQTTQIFFQRLEGETLDSVTIAAPPSLKYRYLINIVDVCYRVGVYQIRFTETRSAVP